MATIKQRYNSSWWPVVIITVSNLVFLALQLYTLLALWLVSNGLVFVGLIVMFLHGLGNAFRNISRAAIVYIQKSY